MKAEDAQRINSAINTAMAEVRELRAEIQHLRAQVAQSQQLHDALETRFNKLLASALQGRRTV